MCHAWVGICDPHVSWLQVGWFLSSWYNRNQPQNPLPLIHSGPSFNFCLVLGRRPINGKGSMGWHRQVVGESCNHSCGIWPLSITVIFMKAAKKLQLNNTRPIRGSLPTTHTLFLTQTSIDWWLLSMCSLLFVSPRSPSSKSLRTIKDLLKMNALIS